MIVRALELIAWWQWCLIATPAAAWVVVWVCLKVDARRGRDAWPLMPGATR